MNNGFAIHTDFNEILAEIAKLQEVDNAIVTEITAFVNSLRELAFKVEPISKMDTEDERQAWKEYRQLNQEKIVLIDISHEYK